MWILLSVLSIALLVWMMKIVASVRPRITYIKANVSLLAQNFLLCQGPLALISTRKPNVN